jgi:hypothetical protein
MTNLLHEHLYAIRDAARQIPTPISGLKLSYGTLHRWCTKGLRGLKLESVKVGGARFTSAEALARFFQALTAERDPVSDPAPDTSASTLKLRTCQLRTESRIRQILGEPAEGPEVPR